ncbi:hypothetical protein G5B37_03565 [Rasiella rasia]|uniref:Uncharacterized protein n=1 Tax=Rasiella rasia TaxID=2744027 RepID=A0A6G6GJJ4_9FLAO|nr:hypothetical protein [Rasiella rasia]QIE58670.1 hypothetical protein G5B37_03565 [Rasiella rasia]
MKTLIFCFLFSTILFGQSVRPEYRNLKCDENLEYDFIEINDKKHIYKIVWLSFEVKDNDTIYIGDIIIPGLDKNTDTLFLKKTLREIGKKEHFSGFMVHGDCKSRDIGFQAVYPSQKEREHMNLYRIGKFYLD